MRLALIPARGGSKRIPRKNIRDFCGRPIIDYSIKAALEAACFDRVIVSTDDQEIAGIARQSGAEVPFMRPAAISDDHATTLDVIRHAIEWYANAGQSVTEVCCLYATAPFVRGVDVLAGLQQLTTGDWEYAFSATSFVFPIQRAFRRATNGSVQMFQPENLNVRSQDLEPAYHDAGQFYWCKSDAVLKARPIYGDRSIACLLERSRVQDIDTLEDWDHAENLFRIIGHD